MHAAAVLIQCQDQSIILATAYHYFEESWKMRPNQQVSFLSDQILIGRLYTVP